MGVVLQWSCWQIRIGEKQCIGISSASRTMEHSKSTRNNWVRHFFFKIQIWYSVNVNYITLGWYFILTSFKWTLIDLTWSAEYLTTYKTRSDCHPFEVHRTWKNDGIVHVSMFLKRVSFFCGFSLSLRISPQKGLWYSAVVPNTSIKKYTWIVVCFKENILLFK